MPEFSALNDNPVRFLVAFVLASGISLLAWKLRSLTPDGAIAAIITGSLIVTTGGWWCGVLLITFFVTGTLLSKLGKNRSTSIRQQRGNQRDAVQVIANGGIPVVLAVFAWISGSDVLLVAAASAIAAATADTWATEIGRISQSVPRSIISWQIVPAGTSGAVSVPGTVATVCGSLLIAIIAAAGGHFAWWDIGLPVNSVGIAVAVAGVLGSLLDSLLGATVQQEFTCKTCGFVTESSDHLPGHQLRRSRGFAGFSNDVVNLTSVVAASLVGLLLAIALE